MSLITISDVYSVFPLFRNSLRRRRWFSAVVSGPDECIDGWMDGMALRTGGVLANTKTSHFHSRAMESESIGECG